jgi:hypothetical protein
MVLSLLSFVLRRLSVVGFLPTFGPCFVNFYGAPREFSAIPTEHDALNEGLVC